MKNKEKIATIDTAKSDNNGPETRKIGNKIIKYPSILA